MAMAGNISVIVNVINEASEACAGGAFAKFCIDGECDRGRGPSCTAELSCAIATGAGKVVAAILDLLTTLE